MQASELPFVKPQNMFQIGLKCGVIVQKSILEKKINSK